MRHQDWIEWEVCARPMPGETVSGDVHVALPCHGGVLLGVIDGLGHGEGAAEAANRARAILLDSPEKRLDDLMLRCHRELHRTRGAAMTIAFIHRHGRLAWLGVGNVEAVLVRGSAAAGRRRESLLLQPGVVGQQIPALRLSEADVAAGDQLVIASDGVRTAFLEVLSRPDSAASIAVRVLAEYGKQTDDALVVAATYLRSAP